MDRPHFHLSVKVTKNLLRRAKTGKDGICKCGQGYETQFIWNEDVSIL